MSRDGGAYGCVPGWAGTNYAWSRTTSIRCRTPSPRRDIVAVMDVAAVIEEAAQKSQN